MNSIPKPPKGPKEPELVGRALLYKSKRELAIILYDMRRNKREEYSSIIMEAVLGDLMLPLKQVKRLLAAMESQNLAVSTLRHGRFFYVLSSKAIIKFLDDIERDKKGAKNNFFDNKQTTPQPTYIYKFNTGVSEEDKIKNLLHPNYAEEMTREQNEI